MKKTNSKVSFCVIEKDDVVPEEYTTYFRSVILFGKASVLMDEVQKRTAFEKFAAKYSPDNEAGRLQEIDKLINNAFIIVIEVEHMTGKEAIELVRQKNK